MTASRSDVDTVKDSVSSTTDPHFPLRSFRSQQPAWYATPNIVRLLAPERMGVRQRVRRPVRLLETGW